MKKRIIILAAAAALLLASPAFAAKDNEAKPLSLGNEHSQSEIHRPDLYAIATTAPEPRVTEQPSPSDDLGQPVLLPIVPKLKNYPIPGVPLSAEENLVIPEPTSSPTPSCNPDQTWKSHGAYVSCVAKLHQGGEVTSEAAKSDIGKKSHASVSPSATPTSSPSATPTGTPSPSPISGPIEEESNGFSFADLGEEIQRVFEEIGKFFRIHPKNR